MKKIALYALSAAFVAAGVMHFANTAFYEPMMPPYLPLHRELIYLSGLLEIVGGVAVLVPRWRVIGGYGLIAILIGVFPANLHMALNEISPPGMEAPVAALWARLPLQAVFIAWAWWVTQPSADAS